MIAINEVNYENQIIKYINTVVTHQRITSCFQSFIINFVMVKLLVYSLCCAASWPRSVVVLETCFQNHWIPAIYERVSLTDFVPVDAALFG